MTGSIREGPSEKKSLAEELAVTEGRKAPQALRRWAAAVVTSPRPGPPGWVRSARRIASAGGDVRVWAPSSPGATSRAHSANRSGT